MLYPRERTPKLMSDNHVRAMNHWPRSTDESPIWDWWLAEDDEGGIVLNRKARHKSDACQEQILCIEGDGKLVLESFLGPSGGLHCFITDHPADKNGEGWTSLRLRPFIYCSGRLVELK